MRELKIVLGTAWGVVGCVPLVILPLFGESPWLGVLGAAFLFVCMVIVAMTTYIRGEIEGMRSRR